MTRYPPYSFHAFDEVGLHGPIPYSLLWYAFYYPLTWLGYWPFFLTVFSIDTILLAKYGTSDLWLAYSGLMSGYFLLVSPHDFLIWTFIFAGRYRPKIFLPLAILAKFPLLPPIPDPSIWTFIFFSPISARDPTNSVRYALMVFAWSVSLATALHDRGRLRFLDTFLSIFTRRLDRSHIRKGPLPV